MKETIITLDPNYDLDYLNIDFNKLNSCIYSNFKVSGHHNPDNNWPTQTLIDNDNLEIVFVEYAENNLQTLQEVLGVVHENKGMGITRDNLFLLPELSVQFQKKIIEIKDQPKANIHTALDIEMTFYSKHFNKHMYPVLEIPFEYGWRFWRLDEREIRYFIYVRSKN